MLEQPSAVTANATLAHAGGASYSGVLKALATAVMVAAVAGLLRLAVDPTVAAPPGVWALLLAALFVVGAGWWNVLTGRTSIDDRVIRQTGLWNKEVAIAGISGCRLVHWPRLAWLVAPRLIVRGGGFGVTTFYAFDAGVLHAFEQLARRASRSP